MNLQLMFRFLRFWSSRSSGLQTSNLVYFQKRQSLVQHQRTFLPLVNSFRPVQVFVPGFLFPLAPSSLFVTKRQIKKPKSPSAATLRRLIRKRRHRRLKRRRVLREIRKLEKKRHLKQDLGSITSSSAATTPHKKPKLSKSSSKRKETKQDHGKVHQQQSRQVTSSEKKDISRPLSFRELVQKMKLLIANDNVEQAEALWIDWKQTLKKPRKFSTPYNLLIIAYAKREAVERILNLIQEMKAVGLTPSCKTYSILIRTYLNMNLVNEALELYNKIKEEQHSRKKPLPSATYNQILIAFANKGDSDTTEKILKDMAFDKINPSRLARLAMKKMYDTKGRPDITMEIYRHFRNLRLSNKE